MPLYGAGRTSSSTLEKSDGAMLAGISVLRGMHDVFSNVRAVRCSLSYHRARVLSSESKKVLKKEPDEKCFRSRNRRRIPFRHTLRNRWGSRKCQRCSQPVSLTPRAWPQFYFTGWLDLHSTVLTTSGSTPGLDFANALDLGLADRPYQPPSSYRITVQLFMIV